MMRSQPTASRAEKPWERMRERATSVAGAAEPRPAVDRHHALGAVDDAKKLGDGRQGRARAVVEAEVRVAHAPLRPLVRVVPRLVVDSTLSRITADAPSACSSPAQ
jgi:hypothetical protein